MAKVSISTLANLDNPTSVVATINANFAAIQTAIEKQLSRDGTAPNGMSANFDANGYRIINLPAPSASTDAARHGDLQGYVTAAQAAQTAAEVAQTAAELAETNAETAETNAETAETGAEAVLVSMNAKWLGTATSDPVNDPSGNPVAAGAFYYNTSTEVFRSYTGSAWVAVPSATLAGLTDTDVGSVSNGQGIAYNSATMKYEPVNLTSGNAWRLSFNPINGEPPASNFATLDVRNNHPCLDFDDTTQETIYFTSSLPTDYVGGGLTISLWCSLTSATTGTVGWLVAIERIDVSSLDIDSDSFASAVTVTAVTVPGTSGQVLKMTVNLSSGAQMDGLLAGELFRLSIARDVATDTATGDAELLAVLIEEQ